MFSTALDRFARQHGLSPEATRDLQELFAARSAHQPLHSTLPDAADAPATAEDIGGLRPRVVARYEDLGLIGMGAMGEVRRVLDPDLNRVMAMKIIRPELLERSSVVARFVEEAQATAQLQHPGVVPVHELGRLPDGRYYFTMKEVRGRTLTEVIQEVHAASRGTAWETGTGGWSLRRLVEAFRSICEAVAHAHARGVVHRDLKPDNVMVGGPGEVLVLDWGLAKVRGRADHVAEAGGLDAVQTTRSADDANATRLGAVAGTPAYMPPEQARGEVNRIDARSDVYALGAILYEVLTGAPPYQGRDAVAVLRQVLAGPPPPPGRLSGSSGATFDFFLESAPLEGPAPPHQLVAACLRAMEREPSDRHEDAAALAADVIAWLDGSRKREQALEIVAAAEAMLPDAARLRATAGALRADAARLLKGVAPNAPVEDKLSGWALQDEAGRLEQEAELSQIRVLQTLRSALNGVPDLPEAHARLVELYRECHVEAEANRDPSAAMRYEALMASHGGCNGPHARYLSGEGALTLRTDPPGAAVEVYRYVPQQRRLVDDAMGVLGVTPLAALPLPMGSYLLVLRAEDRVDTRHPVCIGRQEHWHGTRPGDHASTPIVLPRHGQLGAEDCFIPAGWFWSGGDPLAPGALPLRRLWVDAGVIKRFPVTNRQYVEFLDALVADGREEDALRHAPRERPGTVGEVGALIYGRDDRGRFFLRPDGDGDVWLPEFPVMMVDWFGATAYAAWVATTTGLPWRLPGELEWEKAARGVDGRSFPWGDQFDPTRTCTRQSHTGRPLPSVVDSYPLDESPYGVRGMAGNMRDWCADIFTADGPAVLPGGLVAPPPEVGDSTAGRGYRGGSWNGGPAYARLAGRSHDNPHNRTGTLGFRLYRGM